MRSAKHRKWLGLLAVAAAVACTPRDPGSEGTPGRDGLVTSMEVETAGGVVRMTLHVTNDTSQPLELEFTSGQRYDFAVTRPDGESLWTWSADKSFIQALGSETIPAGGTLRYSEEWDPAGLTGDFVATGTVTSRNRAVAQSAYFDLTEEE